MMNGMGLGRSCAGVVLACLCAGCAPWRGATDAEREGAAMAADLVAAVAAEAGDGPVAWVGVRDGAGHSTADAQAVDEDLLSALVDQPLTVGRVDTSTSDWTPGPALPAGLWHDADEPAVMGARVRVVGAWAYVRLWALQTGTGNVLGASTGKLARKDLEHLANRTRRRQVEVADKDLIQLRFQPLITRVEGGMTRQLELKEGGTLLVGDRLQTRFTTSVDCELYAFLYDSQGVRTDVLSSRLAYAGRVYYGPGQERWITLGEGDRVYTLYVIAAKHLAEDRSDLWDRLAELIQQGRVDRFQGLALQDGALTEFLARELPADSTFTVQRGQAGIRYAKLEEVILEDGTRLEARPEIMEGRGAVVRAVSFMIQ